ncbi:hypothetical protein AA313_de0200061 [Arthrobotrys entomopaga]|nr:hypothetical protein AA313_de0200061 [Arthrobotrys entomopaga]
MLVWVKQYVLDGKYERTPYPNLARYICIGDHNTEHESYNYNEGCEKLPRRTNEPTHSNGREKKLKKERKNPSVEIKTKEILYCAGSKQFPHTARLRSVVNAILRNLISEIPLASVVAIANTRNISK